MHIDGNDLVAREKFMIQEGKDYKLQECLTGNTSQSTMKGWLIMDGRQSVGMVSTALYSS